MRRTTQSDPAAPAVAAGSGDLRRRMAVLGVWGLALLAVLLVRLGDIQIVHAKTLGAAALAEHLKAVPIPAERGEIIAHGGQVLAIDVPAAAVTADPKQVSAPAAEAKRLADLLNVSETTIATKLAVPGSQYAVLEAQATGAQGRAVAALHLPGIYVHTVEVRRYPNGFFMGHLLGFLNDVGGVAGVEQSYNRQLGGTPGYQLAQTGLYGEIIPGTTVRTVPARPGETLRLTVRVGLQAELQRELEVAVATTKASRAYGIVLQPATGAILAASSWPTFDPNAPGDVPPAVWQNTVWSYDMPPGSVFKPVTVSAALSAGIVQPSTPFTDPGILKVGGVSLHNFQKLEVHTTFARAFDESANVIFGRVGLDLGAARFDSALKAFGLFSVPGADLPGQSADILWSPAKINPLALAEESFGESMAVTPLSLITALNVVADGGLLIRPHVGDALLNSAGQVVQRIQPQVVRRVIPAQIAATVRQMMVSVIDDGTGQRGFIPCYDAAGKTGTSNIYQNGKTINSFIASFVDMAPASNPQAIVLIMLYDPQGYFTEGGEVAAPVAQAVLSDALHTLGVPPHCTATNEMPPKPGSAGTTSLVLDMVEMPTIMGMTPTQATTAIRKTDLTLSVSGQGAKVVTQDPPPGAMVQRWTQVEAYTTPQALEPPGFVQVPSVSGQTIAQAAATLAGTNLALVADGVGRAVAQEPPAGSRAQPGTSVQVQFTQASPSGGG